ncbi:amino acid deaminase [Marinimicrobium alkaliphilum]|uniref:amino acid deaminase n=1 Tax=Marinimicrobium alkaliphilum TaxID=2202654 RepID=UPI0018E08C54|nr:amino acid deaminase [Marinimicrobium alkaliphilum]
MHNRNLLHEAIPLPAAVVYQSRLKNNLHWMQTFADHKGVVLAPHGKTTMTPRFFQWQKAAGAWGLSVATVSQAQAAADAGIGRILMANQLVGRANMAAVSELLTQSETLLYCLVDNVDNVRELGGFFAARQQVLPVLIEVGVVGGRCGCRTADEVLTLAEAVAQQPALQLVGVETYEGMVRGDQPEIAVRQHLTRVRDLTLRLLAEDRFDTEQVILTGAGSAWYDLVADIFGSTGDPRLLPVLRPGCYLIHDQGIYAQAQAQVRARLGGHCPAPGDLQSSLEVWAYVQSLPEPGMAILTLGKRDAAFDAGLPQPVLHARPGPDCQARTAPADWQLVKIMDQHSIMHTRTDHDLRVGDIIALATSHPCLTFDKWREIVMIDDDYNVIEEVPTCF